MPDQVRCWSTETSCWRCPFRSKPKPRWPICWDPRAVKNRQNRLNLDEIKVLNLNNKELKHFKEFLKTFWLILRAEMENNQMSKSKKYSNGSILTQKITLKPKMTYLRQHETSLWFRRRLRRRLLLGGRLGTAPPATTPPPPPPVRCGGGIWAKITWSGKKCNSSSSNGNLRYKFEHFILWEWD